MILSDLQRAALDRIEQLATQHRDHNQRLSYEERADMGWIVKYAQYLRGSLTLVQSDEKRPAFTRRTL